MDPQAIALLKQLSQAGDTVDMRQVGEQMGLDRAAVETLGVDLMAQGYLEMVSLSGAVRVTDAGRQAAGGAAGTVDAAAGDPLAALAADIIAAGDLGLEEAAAGDLAVDLQTLQTQMERSQALKPVIDACLKAIAQALRSAPAPAADGLAARAAELLLQ